MEASIPIQMTLNQTMTVERIPVIDQALEIYKLMPEGKEKDRLLVSLARTWIISTCIVAFGESDAQPVETEGVERPVYPATEYHREGTRTELPDLKEA